MSDNDGLQNEEEELFPTRIVTLEVVLPLKETKRRAIMRALRICGWNVARAAEEL